MNWPQLFKGDLCPCNWTNLSYLTGDLLTSDQLTVAIQWWPLTLWWSDLSYPTVTRDPVMDWPQLSHRWPLILWGTDLSYPTVGTSSDPEMNRSQLSNIDLCPCNGPTSDTYLTGDLLHSDQLTVAIRWRPLTRWWSDLSYPTVTCDPVMDWPQLSHRWPLTLWGTDPSYPMVPLLTQRCTDLSYPTLTSAPVMDQPQLPI